ncbi:hypothetical protein [Archangium primigenium]|uniref:hypothetical protein n=1 Tax=[Archangium] primigenium TaxID=2792470 RepID=UPI00195B7A8A|nr:hypothetical protein [Archangium primigenium]MBM7117087.1 hypothetical protein [Archangium primigenium]
MILAHLVASGGSIAMTSTVVDSEFEKTPIIEPLPEGVNQGEEDPWEAGYGELPRQGSEWTEGDLTVSVATGVLRPARGYLPLDIIINNQGTVPRALHIGFTPAGMSVESVVRNVGVAPGQRVSAWIYVPVSMRYGTVRLTGAGTSFQPFDFSALDARGEAVLVLGSETLLLTGTNLPRMDQRPRISARFVPPGDAPQELTAYVGHAATVVAGATDELSVQAWNALEAYAATGGRLILTLPPADIDKRLPLLTDTGPGVHRYGFGHVRLCHHPDECGQGLLWDVHSIGLGLHLWPVAAVGPPMDWESGNHVLANGEQPLLNSDRPSPTARLLVLTVLLVLLMLIGWVCLAQYKKSVVRISIPLLLVLSTMVWSLSREGFSSRSSRYSLVFLDRERSRAVTIGVFGYEIGLRSKTVRIPAFGALLGPDVNELQQPITADWTDGLVDLPRVFPGRTYQEWGDVAVVPTRSRLVVDREGKGIRVHNGLGAPIMEGFVRFDDKVWALPPLADGESAAVVQTPTSTERHTFESFARFPVTVHRRFSGIAWQEFNQPLADGQFFAKLGGAGFGPTEQMHTVLQEGIHFMQGRLDAPSPSRFPD